MAQRIFTAMVCDVHGGTHEATETLHYAVGETSYRVDVCPLGREQVEEHLAVLTGVSTPMTPRSATLHSVASG